MNIVSSPCSGFKRFVLWQAAAVVLAVCAFGALGRAQAPPASTDDALDDQQQGADILSTENLIGTAVSLSNKSYPEVDSAIQRFRNGDIQGAIDYLNQATEKYPSLPPTDVTLAKMQLAARNGNA